jgi:hypothetical protein
MATRKQELQAEAKELGLDLEGNPTIPQLEAAIAQVKQDERPADAPLTPADVATGQHTEVETAGDTPAVPADAPGQDPTDDGGATGIDLTSADDTGHVDDRIAEAQAELGETKTADEPEPVESDEPDVGPQVRVVEGTGGAIHADPPAVPPADGAPETVRPSSTTPADIDGQTAAEYAEAREEAVPTPVVTPPAIVVGEPTGVDQGVSITNGLSTSNAVTQAAPRALVPDIDPRPEPEDDDPDASPLDHIRKLRLTRFTEAQLTDVEAEVRRIRVARRRRQSAPTVREVAVTVPDDPDQSAAFDVEEAASHVGVDASSVLAVSVRQRRGHGGNPVGERFLIVTTNDGGKHAERL